MSSLQSLVLGALLMAVVAFGVQASHPAAAMNGGPYQLMQHSNTTANVGVFRIDTTSGAVSYCYLTGNANLNCTPEVQ